MSKIIATAEVINKNENYTSNVRVNQHVSLVDEPLEKAAKISALAIFYVRHLHPAKPSHYACMCNERNGIQLTFYWLMTLGCKSGVHKSCFISDFYNKEESLHIVPLRIEIKQ